MWASLKGPSWAHWGIPDSGSVILAAACLSGPLILGGGLQAGDACTLSSRPTPSMDSRDPAPPPPLGPMRVTQSPSSEIPQPLCLCSWDHLRATEGGDQSSVTTDVGQGRLILTPVATGASPAQPRHPHFRPVCSWVSGREGTATPCIREEVRSHKVDTEPAILPQVPAFPSRPQGLS